MREEAVRISREVCSKQKGQLCPRACQSSGRNSKGQCALEQGEQGTLVREVKGGQVKSDLRGNLASSEADSKVEFGLPGIYHGVPLGSRPV